MITVVDDDSRTYILSHMLERCVQSANCDEYGSLFKSIGEIRPNHPHSQKRPIQNSRTVNEYGWYMIIFYFIRRDSLFSLIYYFNTGIGILEKES